MRNVNCWSNGNETVFNFNNIQIKQIRTKNYHRRCMSSAKSLSAEPRTDQKMSVCLCACMRDEQKKLCSQQIVCVCNIYLAHQNCSVWQPFFVRFIYSFSVSCVLLSTLLLSSSVRSPFHLNRRNSFRSCWIVCRSFVHFVVGRGLVTTIFIYTQLHFQLSLYESVIETAFMTYDQSLIKSIFM